MKTIKSEQLSVTSNLLSVISFKVCKVFAFCFITFNCIAQTAYITNNADNTVSVINVATNTVTATIPVGHAPWGVSVSPDGNKVYITDANADTVSIINTATNTVSATIPVGHAPWGVSVSPDGNKVYITDANADTVSIINTATNTVSATIPVGNHPIAFGNFISSYTTGIASINIEPESIEVYPNPTNGKIQVISKQYSVSSIEIYNVFGENIYQLPITAHRSPITIDLSDKPSGVYIVKVKTEKGVVVKKVIKK